MSDAEDKESLARSNLPYRAEYCKTSRAKCKKCSENMEAGSLKLAVMTKSRWHDGYDAAYFHVNCFFRMKRPASVAEIHHFETLKFADQQMLIKAIETNGKSVLGVAVNEATLEDATKGKKSKGKKSAKKRGPDEVGVLVNYDDFLVEYAKSSRSTCKRCEEKIPKDTVRLGKLDYDAETPNNAGPVPRWYHLECFIQARDRLEFFGEIKKVKGFNDLEKDDRKMLKEAIKPIKPPEDETSPEKKPKKEDAEAKSSQAEEEMLLKKQSDRFFKLREFVDSMKRKDIEQMLEYMDQKADFKASALLVDMATDVLLYGPLQKCPQCHSSRTMILRGGSYICIGTIDDKPCTYETRDPKRDVPDVPEEIVEKYYDFFEHYRFKGGKRIFLSKFIDAVKQKEAEDNHTALGDAPLNGLNIGIISWNSLHADKTKVQKKITTLGGQLKTALDSSVFVIITSEAELSKDAPKVEVAKALNIPFVTEDFLFKIQKREDVVSMLKKFTIGNSDGIEERFKKMSKVKDD